MVIRHVLDSLNLISPILQNFIIANKSLYMVLSNSIHLSEVKENTFTWLAKLSKNCPSNYHNVYYITKINALVHSTKNSILNALHYLGGMMTSSLKTVLSQTLIKRYTIFIVIIITRNVYYFLGTTLYQRHHSIWVSS